MLRVTSQFLVYYYFKLFIYLVVYLMCLSSWIGWFLLEIEELSVFW